MTFVFRLRHNQAIVVITVFKCFFTVGTIDDDDVIDAVVCRACTGTKSNIGNFNHKTKTVKDISTQLVVSFIALCKFYSLNLKKKRCFYAYLHTKWFDPE